MTIASDRWIRAQCMGELHFELYYDDAFQGVYAADLFDRDQVVDKRVLLTMKPGEEKTFKGSGSVIKIKCVETLPPEGKPLIEPFVSESVKHILVNGLPLKCPSYGLSSFGYDIRVDRKFKRIKPMHESDYGQDMIRFGDCFVSTVADHTSERHPSHLYEDHEGDYIDILPHEFILGVSVERIAMPAHVTATCMAKSTLARLGLDASVTPIEAGWSGYITLEIYNKTPNVIRLYSGVGIMQLLFNVGSENCMVSYADRAGKYQDQPATPVVGSF